MPTAAIRFRPWARHLPHLVFFLLLVGPLPRMLLDLGNERCWYVAVLTALLAACYAAGLAWDNRLGRGRPIWLGLLLSLWLPLVYFGSAPVSMAYAWCAVPLACVIVAALGRRAALAVLAVVTALLVVALARHAHPVVSELVAAPVVALWATAALFNVQQRDAAARQRLIEQLRTTQDELTRRHREAAVLAERARIAQELHDTLVQELAGSRMLLQSAEREWEGSPDAARSRVRVVAQSLGEFLDETRRIVEDLTPPALDQHDLESALRTLCSTAQHDGTAPSVTFRMVGDPAPVPAEIAATLLRMAQGALANVRDHADARTAEVTLAWCGGSVTLEVCDDGTGFDPQRIRPMPGRGYGLAAIRERLYTHAGSLTVSSRPGRGTRITAAVPLLEPATPAVRPEPDHAIHAR